MGLRYFHDLLRQRERVETFRRAITAVVRPGDVVLEVGAGLGTFAFFAAQAGARIVYAVDEGPVIHVAAALARENGLADRVRCVRGRMPDVDLPERADVVIFEDFPPRVFDTRVVDLYAALVARYARPGARWIPRAVRRSVAAAAADAGAAPAYGLSWQALAGALAHEPQEPPEPPELISAPALLDETVLRTVTAPEARTVELRVSGAGPVRGLVLWGDLVLAEGMVASNAPDAAAASWGRVWLPVTPALPAAVGDVLSVTIGHHAGAGWLTWRVATGGHGRAGHEFAGRPLARADLLAGSPDAVPALAERGAMIADLLARVDATRTLRDVAAGLRRRRPWLTDPQAVHAAARLLDGLVDWRPPG